MKIIRHTLQNLITHNKDEVSKLEKNIDTCNLPNVTYLVCDCKFINCLHVSVVEITATILPFFQGFSTLYLIEYIDHTQQTSQVPSLKHHQ